MESVRAKLLVTENPPKFGFGCAEPLPCRLERVYDGDTITIAFPCGGPHGPIVSHSMRIAGIDAPEMRPRKNALKPGFASKEDEVEAAAWAQNAALAWCLKHQDSDGLLFSKCAPGRNGIDKYGRMLGDLLDAETQTVSLATHLMACGAAVAYDERRDADAWALAKQLRAAHNNAII